MKAYELVKTQPIAKFWYKGSHTHPMLKVGLVIKERTNATMITMYVLKDGKQTFKPEDAPVRAFRRDKIAKYYSLRAPVRQRLGVNEQQLHMSTLERHEISDLMSVI